MGKQFNYIKRQIKVFNKQKTSIVTKMVFFLAVTQVSLYIVLFSEYPAIHDYFHELRHVLAIVPCH